MRFFVFLHYITRRVPVQRAVERDEIPYPHKVHDTALRPLLNITIVLNGYDITTQSTILVRSRSRSCSGGDICGTTPAFRTAAVSPVVGRTLSTPAARVRFPG